MTDRQTDRQTDRIQTRKTIDNQMWERDWNKPKVLSMPSVTCGS